MAGARMDTEPRVIIDPVYLSSETIDRIGSLLLSSPVLDHLDSDELRLLTTESTLIEVEPPEPFELGPGLYLVARGRLTAQLGALIYPLHPGQFAGEHHFVPALSGIAPQFTPSVSSELICVPSRVVRGLLASARHLENDLLGGPLFENLTRAALASTESASSSTVH